LDLNGFLVFEYAYHGRILAIQSIDIFQLSVGSFWVYKPNKLIVTVSVYVNSRNWEREMGTYWHKNGIENHPNQIESPTDVSNPYRCDLDHNVIGDP